MIRFLAAFLLFSSFMSCKKIQEDVQENRAMGFITSGQWKVKSLTKNGVNHTSVFAPYLFRFRTDKKVEALNNGMVEVTGDWEGNINAATLQSNFPTTAAYPLPLLNGTWQITDGGNNYTVANKTENGEVSVLRLEKI